MTGRIAIRGDRGGDKQSYNEAVSTLASAVVFAPLTTRFRPPMRRASHLRLFDFTISGGGHGMVK
jgi:hypothetical protein